MKKILVVLMILAVLMTTVFAQGTKEAAGEKFDSSAY